jgi:hypothetical protein
MKKMKKVIFLMLTLIVLSAASMNAQVLIGDNTKEPHAGSILDLSPLGTQKLGVLLPKVELGSTADEFVLIASPTSEQKIAARGMIVYNTKTTLNGAGLYVWTGELWKPVVLAGV